MGVVETIERWFLDGFERKMWRSYEENQSGFFSNCVIPWIQQEKFVKHTMGY